MMKKLLLTALLVSASALAGAQPYSAQIQRALNNYPPKSVGDPYTCDSTTYTRLYTDVSAVPYILKQCVTTGWVAISTGTGSFGANEALSNLASVDINTSLFAQANVDLGSTTKPFRNLYIYGNGTYGTGSIMFGGNPTGHRLLAIPDSSTAIPIIPQTITVTGPSAARTWTVPDAAFSIARTDAAQTFTGTQTFGAGTVSAPGIAIGAGARLWSRADAAFDITTPVFGATDTHFEIVGDNSASVTSIMQIGWASSATDAGGGLDTGLGRSAAGVVKITNGSSGAGRLTHAGDIIYTSGAMAVADTSAASCGTTAATIAGTSTTGIVTIGAVSGTSCTVTFPVAATTRRQCVINNETTANLARATYSTSTVMLFAGTFVGGDVISYICATY